MLFERVAELVVGQSGGKGILIKDLRIAFNIEKSASETLNSSTVRIYNLNMDSRALVETPNNVIILKAGYKYDVGALTIFTGIVRRALTSREGADWVTELELDDGLLAYRDAKFTASYAPNISGLDVLKQIAAKFDIPVRPLPPDIPNKMYPNGFSFVGRTRDAMTKVCNYLGLDWSIQNQEIQIVKKGSPFAKSAIVLSSDSGMIGSPELEAKTMSTAAAAKKGITTNTAGVISRPSKTSNKDGETRERLEVQGYKVTSLLQPTLEPCGIVKLKAIGIDNFFKIEKLTHVGDTHGNDWYSEMSLRFI
jgi:hypothetical protein